MTVPVHPVRKRLGISRAGLPWLPSALLIPALVAILGLIAVVASARNDLGFGELSPLRVPPALALVHARRLASSVISKNAIRSATCADGVSTGEHVAALARHQALRDRPAREPHVDQLRQTETISQFRRRWRLSEVDLARLNPDVDLERVEPGQALVVWRYDPGNPSRSFFAPNRGRLENGEPMPEGRGWIVRNVQYSYGAIQTIDGLIDGLRQVMATHPGGQEVLVADLSTPRGGRLPPHRSHQSGRDADVTYYRLSHGEPTFTRTRVSELDLKRTWTFVRTLLLRHDMDYIFTSRPIQRALYEYAESIGEHPAFLDRVFERGDDGRRNPRSVIRFAPGHHDHLHVRFGCAPHDVRCESVDTF